MIATISFLVAFTLDYLTRRPDVVASLTMRAPLKRRVETLLALVREEWSPAPSLREQGVMTAAAITAVPTALLLYATAALTLGALGTRPGWDAALIALIFVVPTLISGVALWTLVSAYRGQLRRCAHVPRAHRPRSADLSRLPGYDEHVGARWHAYHPLHG